MVGVDRTGVNAGELYTIIGAELQLTEKLFVGATGALNEKGYEVRVRYGVESGLFGRAFIDESGILNWNAGVFVQRPISERLGIRAMISIYGAEYEGTVYLYPDAHVGLRYHLSGPFALYSEATAGSVSGALAYEF